MTTIHTVISIGASNGWYLLQIDVKNQLSTYSDTNWAGCPDTPRSVTRGLGFPQIESTSLYVDNTSVIQIVANPIFHEHTKHMEANCHLICDAYDEQLISLSHEEKRQDNFRKEMEEEQKEEENDKD
ncbi:uncharacterized protein LOC127122681 [Lathyrus oleraceus]|uniref:uncharacterized protein LOC127122681 n=1 Tax=Pisum sativum TaxID=3888 RepID=UPI0021CE4327|nr:uncharacterized protein LOC127122681 [Pisum sativum]